MRFRHKGRNRDAGATVIDAQLRDAHVEGPLAIGEHIAQYVAAGDIVVKHVAPAEQPVLKLRQLPVRHLPRDFPEPLGRGGEVTEALKRLASAESVELVGASGIGKTVMLRHLAHRLGGEVAREGVLHTYCGEQPAGDLLQWLFESFVECDVRTKATPAQLDDFLRARVSVVVLDDVGIDRDALGKVADVVPGCTLLWASPRRLLWGEGGSFELSALPDDSALALFQREAGSTLPESASAAARAVCRTVRGHPLRVLQAAALVRAGRGPSLEVLAALPDPPAFDLAREQALTDAERRILGPLAALQGASLRGEDVAAIVGAPEAEATLESLIGRGIVEAHSPRYSIAGEPGPLAAAAAPPWRDRVLEHFAFRNGAPREAAADLPAVLGVLEHGVAMGRWSEVLAVVRREERRLALNGLWDAWALVLEHGRFAAEASDDRSAAAWIQHQLGTRALCLGDTRGAAALLGAALALRRELADNAGVARTERHLQRARELDASAPVDRASETAQAAPRPRPSRVRGARGWPPNPRLTVPLIAVGAAGLGVATGMIVGDDGTDSVPAVARARTVTGPDRIVTVTRTVRETANGPTVTALGAARTVTRPARTVTVAGKEVTVTETVTDTVTETATETVTTTVFTTSPPVP